MIESYAFNFGLCACCCWRWNCNCSLCQSKQVQVYRDENPKHITPMRTGVHLQASLSLFYALILLLNEMHLFLSLSLFLHLAVRSCIRKSYHLYGNIVKLFILSAARIEMGIGVYELIAIIITVTIESSFMLKWMFCAHSVAYVFKSNGFYCVHFSAVITVCSPLFRRHKHISTGFCLSTANFKPQSRSAIKMLFNRIECP